MTEKKGEGPVCIGHVHMIGKISTAGYVQAQFVLQHDKHCPEWCR